ncbi:hypothetical protein ACVC7V_12580 [Hydrogenophaga sp. A37]|uniref:hypothetical protein n=1 Tax=Hydrogenophaga sp. A37 TaxID=1945864 RepID=UPI000987C84A|nr:hypothetical protein [Hydrogenophaga sp. A37]OOG80366.1 hypothetical protein B0E41_20890 [Hydrogenophaga sp. A37]
MNAAFREVGLVGAVERQAWLFDFMRSLDRSELSERERKACWTWAVAWSLCMTSQSAQRAPRYPYEWVLRQVRHPALRGCR